MSYLLYLISVFDFQGTSFISEKLMLFHSYRSGSHLLSHIVSNIVPSAAQVLTIVFGMRTGVTPERIATGNVRATKVSAQTCLSFLECSHSLDNSYRAVYATQSRRSKLCLRVALRLFLTM